MLTVLGRFLSCRWTLPFLASAALGCGTAYGPALYDSGLPAPVPFSSATRGSFVAVDGSRGDGFNEGERMLMARGHYLAVDGDGALRWSYGGFLYGGSYRIQKRLTSLLRGPREFGGFGAEGDLSFSRRFGAVEIGGGVYAMFGMELGPYALLWKMRGALPLLAGAGIYSSLALPAGNDAQLALQLGMGMPGLVTFNGQIALDRIVIWGGFGTSLDGFPRVGNLRRVSAGLAVHLD